MRRLKVLLLLGLVVLLAAATSEAALQPTRARGQQLDHFWCYGAEGETRVVGGVWLQDQFDIASGAFQETRVGPRQFFCNPVVKRHNNRVTPIRDKDAHLTFYNLPTPTDVAGPQRLIVYSNQFQRKHAALLGQAEMLAVPTQKIEPGNHDFPRRLDHFKCYRVLKSKPANAASVGLGDQFSRTASSVDVGGLGFFCNPTRKIRLDDAGNIAEVTGVQNATDHLACFRAPDPGRESTDVEVRNQFEEARFSVNNAQMLCVPTAKHHLGEVPSFTDIAPGHLAPDEG